MKRYRFIILLLLVFYCTAVNSSQVNYENAPRVAYDNCEG